MQSYDRAALKVLESNDITPERLGKIVYSATSPPYMFTKEESEKSSFARKELLSLEGGLNLYREKMRELRQR